MFKSFLGGRGHGNSAGVSKPAQQSTCSSSDTPWQQHAYIHLLLSHISVLPTERWRLIRLKKNSRTHCRQLSCTQPCYVFRLCTHPMPFWLLFIINSVSGKLFLWSLLNNSIINSNLNNDIFNGLLFRLPFSLSDLFSLAIQLPLSPS